jgi:hypothetical protein
VEAYSKILGVWRILIPSILLLLGVAALLYGHAEFAAFLGGTALLLAAASVRLFHRFLPQLPASVASAALFAGAGIGVAIGFTGRPLLSLVIGLGFGIGMMVSLAGVGAIGWLLMRIVPTTTTPAAEATRVSRRFLVLAYFLTLPVVLAPLIGLALVIGVRWPFAVAWLVLSTCASAGALLLGLRAANKRGA